MQSRRGFFKGILGMVGIGFLLRATPSLAKKLGIGLDKAAALKAVGGSVILQVKDKQVLFIRDTEKTVRALSPICTHQKCTVAYNPKSNQIECGCHKSRFDLSGKVLQGPATAPLPCYPATLEGDRIVVSLD